ncbi:MAG: methyltransferase domain-containing protein [Chloroflexota bacterium]
MKAHIAQRLLALNRRFYTDFGASFSATRGRIQPGVRRVLDSLKGDETILDLGCGNGGLARALAGDGHRGAYLGLDFSLPLLSEAESMPQGFPAQFREADLTQLSVIRDQLSVVGHQPSAAGHPLAGTGWSLITAFAVLHHIPGQRLRQNILEAIHTLLAEGGRFIHSNWQFLHSPRLRQRVREWSEAGLAEADVDENDYLLDWRSGGAGLRYAHHFSEAELAGLAASSGFKVAGTFYSDGREGNLAVYQAWEKA